MRQIDVTVCGAGISGLLVASELSKSCSVVVLEKSARVQCSNKFWLTKSECLDRNPELADCVDSEWGKIDFIANDRSKFSVEGHYILWDTKKLESHLVDSISKNGSMILYQHRLYGYNNTADSIVSYANNDTFSSSLVIDCMGYSSPIVNATNAVRILGYYHLYGRTMGLKKPINPVAADNVVLSGTPSFLEIFPKSDSTANVVLIVPAKIVHSEVQLENEFDFIVSNTHYTDVFVPMNDGSVLCGTVPVGVVRKRALNRVLFYGEAGQIHPAASCTCLNKLLMGHKKVAERVMQRIESNSLSMRDLSDVVPQMSQFSQRFHQNLFRQMGTWTSADGRPLVELLRCLDQKSLDDLIFGEIGLSHFMQLQNLKRVAKARSTIWLKPFIRTLINV